MVKITTWSLDTCKCVFEIDETGTFVDVMSPCPLHSSPLAGRQPDTEVTRNLGAGLQRVKVWIGADAKQVFDNAYEENTRVGRTLSEIHENLKTILPSLYIGTEYTYHLNKLTYDADTTANQSDLAEQVKFAITLRRIGLSYNANRVLNVLLKGITLAANQKKGLQTVIDNKIGAGKVLVQ